MRKAEAGFLGDYSMLEENPGPGARLRYLREGVDWKRYHVAGGEAEVGEQVPVEAEGEVQLLATADLRVVELER